MLAFCHCSLSCKETLTHPFILLPQFTVNKENLVFQVIKQSCAKVLSCMYCNTSEDASIITSMLEQICLFLNCSCTSLAGLSYLAFHSYTLITCLKFIFSIMKRSQQNWSEDLCWFQILTMAQACGM